MRSLKSLVLLILTGPHKIYMKRPKSFTFNRRSISLRLPHCRAKSDASNAILAEFAQPYGSWQKEYFKDWEWDYSSTTLQIVGPEWIFTEWKMSNWPVAFQFIHLLWTVKQMDLLWVKVHFVPKLMFLLVKSRKKILKANTP